MAIAVNPVAPAYYINAANVSSTSGTSAYAAYEQLLELQAETDLLNIGQTSTTTGANDNILLTSDLLDLSPAALNILNGVNAGAGITDTTTTDSVLEQQILTPYQQQQAATIVEQFANQPLTPQTFTEIQNALTAAGINPAQVSIQELFNAYAYAYVPGFSTNEQLFTDTLAADLTNS